MTERFTLAAQVLLTRRLKNLLRIDETTEIDQSYITCAEYQLFINAQRAKRKYVQPDHWTTKHFAPGTAKQLITGIRAHDAVAFCAWLTQQQSLPGFRYRLPTSSEASEHPMLEKSIGYWCQSSKPTFRTLKCHTQVLMLSSLNSNTFKPLSSFEPLKGNSQ